MDMPTGCNENKHCDQGFSSLPFFKHVAFFLPTLYRILTPNKKILAMRLKLI